MVDWKLLLALLMIVVGLAMLGTVVIVALFPSTVEEGSFIDKYIKPHTEEQVSIQEEEMEMIGNYYIGFLYISKMHDNKDNVTCWIQGEKGGMACIPDHMLTP